MLTPHRIIPHKQRGGTLVEALVSVLLFMFGILGLIGLQGRMGSAATDAQLRGEATNLADQLISQMWLDQANISQYTVASGSCSTSSNAYCSDWLNMVKKTLPAGTATVTVAGNAVQVEVSWKVASSSTHRVQTSAVINF